MAKSMKYDQGTCPVDGTGLRRMYALAGGGGKNSKTQHSRFKVCERGHQIYRKTDARH